MPRIVSGLPSGANSEVRMLGIIAHPRDISSPTIVKVLMSAERLVGLLSASSYCCGTMPLQ